MTDITDSDYYNYIFYVDSTDFDDNIQSYFSVFLKLIYNKEGCLDKLYKDIIEKKSIKITIKEKENFEFNLIYCNECGLKLTAIYPDEDSEINYDDAVFNLMAQATDFSQKDFFESARAFIEKFKNIIKFNYRYLYEIKDTNNSYVEDYLTLKSDIHLEKFKIYREGKYQCNDKESANTPLMWAIWNENYPMVNLLLDYAKDNLVDILQFDGYGKTIATTIILNGRIEHLKKLFELVEEGSIKESELKNMFNFEDELGLCALDYYVLLNNEDVIPSYLELPKRESILEKIKKDGEIQENILKDFETYSTLYKEQEEVILYGEKNDTLHGEEKRTLFCEKIEKALNGLENDLKKPNRWESIEYKNICSSIVSNSDFISATNKRSAGEELSNKHRNKIVKEEKEKYSGSIARQN